jgi:uncharacterized protein
MKHKKIVIAGGSGFIGMELMHHFANENEICILTRKIEHAANNRNKQIKSFANSNAKITYILWDAKTLGDWCACLENADVLINLTGRTVNCRYTDAN